MLSDIRLKEAQASTEPRKANAALIAAIASAVTAITALAGVAGGIIGWTLRGLH